MTSFCNHDLPASEIRDESVPSLNLIYFSSSPVLADHKWSSSECFHNSRAFPPISRQSFALPFPHRISNFWPGWQAGSDVTACLLGCSKRTEFSKHSSTCIGRVHLVCREVSGLWRQSASLRERTRKLMKSSIGLL